MQLATDTVFSDLPRNSLMKRAGPLV